MLGLGGGLAKLAQIREYKRYRQCARCRLRYHEREDKCPHCGDLDDAALAQFLEQRRSYRHGRRWLGRLFFGVAALVAVILLIALL